MTSASQPTVARLWIIDSVRLHALEPRCNIVANARRFAWQGLCEWNGSTGFHSNEQSSPTSRASLEDIFPILVGKPRARDSGHYPSTGNFFADGTSNMINSSQLVEKVVPSLFAMCRTEKRLSRALMSVPFTQYSPPTTRAVVDFLHRNHIALSPALRTRSVRCPATCQPFTFKCPYEPA